MTATLTQPEPAVLSDADPVTLRRDLRRQYAECELLRPFRVSRYEPGERLELSVTGVVPANTGRIVVEIEKFVGGGFAGQVYRVRLAELVTDDGPIAGLSVGQTYAIKILRPPSGFSCLFRDFLYFLAYQGAFSAQVNPSAVRVGVLWQKLIRRAAARRLGAANAVCDTFATFYDPNLRSFGEINEWVTGRIWKFEVDDRLFDRWEFDSKPPADLNSGEYVHKRIFMRDLVALLHEMGAPELARQYEWWTCKSQPNALKRVEADDDPAAGLTAIDFRAGLALLPFLPMSPADFWLIARGVGRGRIVQFDRPDTARFERFLAEHADEFDDLRPAIEELRQQEPIHRRSLPDITHHRFRLLTDASLRKSVREGTIVGWRSLGRIDDEHATRLQQRGGLFALMYAMSLVPLLGRVVLKLWGNTQTREHVKRALTSFRYLWRAMRGARIEAIITWHRQGRVSDERALALVHRPVRFWTQRILVGWMPPTWHRALCEPEFGWAKVREKARFIWQFLREPPFREQWLLEQVRLGREEGMLTDQEAEEISAQATDPYIQKYLKSVGVHICTVPVTQLVSVSVALYVMVRFGKSWQESVTYALGVLALFQVTPISPGSIARGSYVVYLIVRERNLRNYWLAAIISFWKYIGYLGFPIQMVRQYPSLSRLMAGRWARNMVHVVPVFGEHGGLPEHMVFDLFFNLPLSLRDFPRLLKRSLRTDPIKTSVLTLTTIAAVVYSMLVILILVYTGFVHLLG